MADMLTESETVSMAHFDSVEMPLSKIKVGVAKVSKRKGTLMIIRFLMKVYREH